MENSYLANMALLPQTYRWAKAFPMDGWMDVFRDLSSRPLMVVGSGGSYSVAHFVSTLHEHKTGYVAKAVTPLEFVASASTLKDCNVFFITSSGTNVDIIQAFKRSLKASHRTWVLCSNVNSPIVHACRTAKRTYLLEFPLNYEQDGFLATKALLAQCILLWRGYHGSGIPLADTVECFMSSDSVWRQLEAEVLKAAETVLFKTSLVVLYGPRAKAAAVDLESKMTEAALAQVQLADYRSFAHGRHYWLGSDRYDAGIVAFATEHDRKLAEATLALIPQKIPRCVLHIPGDGITCGLSAVIYTLLFVRAVALGRNIDPANPEIPEFGWQIFRLEWDDML